MQPKCVKWQVVSLTYRLFSWSNSFGRTIRCNSHSIRKLVCKYARS
jgi:hypothetical protein